MCTKTFRLTLVFIAMQMFSYGQSEGMVHIKGARYIPLYGRDSTVVEVKDFKMDKYPVTVEDFELFVLLQPA